MRARPRRMLRQLAALGLLALAGTGCQTPRHIRDAQSAFNDAARAENADRMAAPDSSALLTSNVAAANGYRIALGLVEQELAEHETELRKDDLLGAALMLRALSLWRIADLESRDEDRAKLDAAVADLQARVSASPPDVVLGPRDTALLTALPGLRDHDLGLRQHDYASAQPYFQSAFRVYQRALESPNLPPNHPLRTYLMLSELATLRAWIAAADSLPGEKRNEEWKRLLDCGNAVARELQPFAGQDASLDRLVRWYAQGLGISWPDVGDGMCSIN